ncbi:MAG: hypothetical protein GWN29_04965 [Gammaproteobacteria bacterium]|nr:hypothetical protein [Gammaproteobacteria bacterium]NIV51105.1 hypothetical protein [Gammaproteobacteria bacterium]NIW23957.1 hypothetical protein [Gammaproteobacteria bacterium]NIX85047.1 hypothetical protein [Gammaproteobacteria bacterium]
MAKKKKTTKTTAPIAGGHEGVTTSGMPVEVAKSARSDMPASRRYTPFGVPGLRRKGGEVDEEWLSDLRGSKAAKVYREMADNDAIVGAFLLVVEMLLRQTDYRIEPADNSPLAKATADFAESAIDDMRGGMPGFMTEFLTSLVYGWAWMEKLWKIRRGPSYETPQLRSRYHDGRIGLQRIQLIGQESLHEWLFDEADQVIAMVQQAPPPNTGLRTIPREKALHVRFRYTKDNPEGYSLLRVCYQSYYHKKNLQFVEAVGIERDLAGYPVMEVPAELLESTDSADTTVVDEYKDLVRKIKADEYQGVVIPSETGPDGQPSGFRLRLLTSGGRRPADVDPVIRRYDSRIAMSLMSEFLVVGLDKVGSLALHSDKTALFSVALGALLDERDRQWNDEVFPELMILNGWPAEAAPRLVHGDIEKVDLQALGAFLTSAVGSGAVTVDDRLESWVRERTGLPEPEYGTARAAAPADALPLVSGF